MNLKLRFALLFTFFVAVILIISSGTIYFLYYNYREAEFFQRVKNEGLEFHNTVKNKAVLLELDSTLFRRLLRNSTVYDERIVIMDINGKVLHKLPDTLHFAIDHAALEKIKKQDEYVWYDADNYQHVGILLKGTGEILVSAGYDRPGLEKLYNLRIILIAVLTGALLFTAFISFVFVREAFMPLKRLSMQMKQTTFQNLSQRLPIGDSKDEISDIARNFNGMLERLNGAFDFQKSFVYHASHELRTPLATMLSETESALSKKLTVEEYDKVLFSLKEEQQELIELTNSLLLISQSDEMGYTQAWPLVRIDEVLYDAISYSKKMFRELSIDMVFGAMPDNAEDLVVRANESLLKSVFVNLVKNAFMYSIDQKVKITLEAAGDTILIHFDNTGTQLPADEKENIMSPFFRGGNALKTKGYGLGLAIVYRFISLHKGTVTYMPVSNDVNRFTITLNKAAAQKEHKKTNP
jgi:signal transduction histidine kinase